MERKHVTRTRPGVPPPHRAMIILDGLGDRPNATLQGRTALEAAQTPNLDRLASVGTLGLAVPVGRNVAPESDAGVLGLLGYDPRRESPGRGVLEAEGLRVPLPSGALAFRCNFATLERSGVIRDSRVGRSLGTQEAARLAEALTKANLLKDQGIRVRVLATVGHRGVVLLTPQRGRSLSEMISNSDPFYTKDGGLGRAVKPRRPVPKTVRPLDGSRQARETAEATNLLLARMRLLLAEHPVNRMRRGKNLLEANGILLRDAGVVGRTLEPFRRRWGLSGAALTEMPVERGLARLLGLRDVFVGPLDPMRRKEGLESRAARTVSLLRRYPFVYVHLKGPDEPGHDGDAPRKKEIIEELDRFYFGPLLSKLDLDRVRLVVTADHATPCVLKGHSADPVPLLYAGGPLTRARAPRERKFSERSARSGPLGLLIGPEIMRLLIYGPSRADG